MTPTEFDFTVTMPGDSRLVGAIRQLTTHAAGYAHLSADAAERLAGHVEHATEQAIAASRVRTGTIEFRFSADAESLAITFSCDCAAAARPSSSSSDEVTVDWTTEGTTCVCRIRQRLTGA